MHQFLSTFLVVESPCSNHRSSCNCLTVAMPLARTHCKGAFIRLDGKTMTPKLDPWSLTAERALSRCLSTGGSGPRYTSFSAVPHPNVKAMQCSPNPPPLLPWGGQTSTFEGSLGGGASPIQLLRGRTWEGWSAPSMLRWGAEAQRLAGCRSLEEVPAQVRKPHVGTAFWYVLGARGDCWSSESPRGGPGFCY